MGKNNRRRRAAKQKKRREQARRDGGRQASGYRRRSARSLDDAELVEMAVYAERVGDTRARAQLLDELGERPQDGVLAELQRRIDQGVAAAWEGGWQPADLVRFVSRYAGANETEMVVCAIADDVSSYEQWGRAVAPDWMLQLEEIGAHRSWATGASWLVQMRFRWHDKLAAAIGLLGLLGTLPELPLLRPPPSHWPGETERRPVASRLEPGVLAKIRALLAKAESTSFDAEAEAFTAKAQELMTRHRIDRAALSGDMAVGDEEVVGRRIGIDDPYAKSKVVLLGGIARANSCRAVWSKDFGFATVFGFPEDIDGVEELFTSLLVQATTAMQREGSKQDLYGRSRTTRFRRSFLISFADRVSERLRETNDETVRTVEDETGAALVPLLDRREQAAEDAMESAFSGGLGSVGVSVSDYEGYLAGRRVADQADLSFGKSDRRLRAH